MKLIKTGVRRMRIFVVYSRNVNYVGIADERIRGGDFLIKL